MSSSNKFKGFEPFKVDAEIGVEGEVWLKRVGW